MRESILPYTKGFFVRWLYTGPVNVLFKFSRVQLETVVICTTRNVARQLRCWVFELMAPYVCWRDILCLLLTSSCLCEQFNLPGHRPTQISRELLCGTACQSEEKESVCWLVLCSQDFPVQQRRHQSGMSATLAMIGEALRSFHL